MVLCVDSQNKAQTIHGISNFGGTLRRIKNDIIQIIEMGQGRVCVEIAENILAVNCTFDASSLNEYKQWKSAEELENLEPS